MIRRSVFLPLMLGVAVATYVVGQEEPTTETADSVELTTSDEEFARLSMKPRGDLTLVEANRLNTEVNTRRRNRDTTLIPYQEIQFTSATTKNEKCFVAATLVFLGADEKYWSFLVEQSLAALDRGVPSPVDLEAWRSGSEAYTTPPKFAEWLRETGLSATQGAKLAVEDALAVQALGMTADPRAFPLLARGLKSENYYLAHTAARGLARLQDARAIELIIDAANDAPPELRTLIAINLAYFENSKAQRAAGDLIEDEALLHHVREQFATSGDRAIYGF